MKGYSVFPKAPALQEVHYQIIKSHIQNSALVLWLINNSRIMPNHVYTYKHILFQTVQFSISKMFVSWLVGSLCFMAYQHLLVI